jgi:hypothetical protein
LPEDSASDIELTPDLHTQAFSDPDIQDSHAGSHWQISTAENFSVLICDHQSQTDLTAFVPPEPLQEDTIYYWRVRFYDNNGGASPWSETFSFTTRSAEEAEEVDSQENKDSNEDAENYFEENGCYIMSLGF